MATTQKIEPSSFRKYALVASGNLRVKGSLTTDGPLGDVFVAKEIKARALSLDISGKIKASNSFNGSLIRSFDYKDVNSQEFVKIRALKVSEYLNKAVLDDYYLLGRDGKAIHKIKGQNSMSLPKNITANFSNGVWSITGDSVEIDSSLVVEGDLNITASSLFVKGTLMVQGDLHSLGKLNINQGTPFDKALIVDKNIEVDALTTIGRIHGSGNFISHSTVNILGNAEIDGDVTLYGDAKINLLDNVYKSALYDAQTESKDKNISLTLVHSKLFSDVSGKNSVVLFTFVEGNYIMNEDTILNLIEHNATQKYKFKSYLYGASINYGSQLQKFDGLSSYFENKKNIISLLKNKGYSDIQISESIDIAPSNLYLSFETKDGTKIGTYLVYSISKPYINELIELTPTQRDKALYALTHKDEIEQQNEIDSQAKMQEQKDSIINNQELNLTTKSTMLNEITQAEDNTSTIDKEALKTEATTNRVQEWVQYKNLASDTKIVPAQKVTDVNSTKARGFWSFIRHIFRVVTFNYCYKHTQTKRIYGVDSDSVKYQADRWYKDITIYNKNYDYCTPTAIAMIINYHYHILKGRSRLYAGNTFSRNNPESGRMAQKFHTQIHGGTAWYRYPIQVPYETYREIRSRNMYGYAWTWYTAFWNRWWQHYIIKYYINRNNPVMFNAMGGTVINGVKKLKVGHSMPVIGYKREYYTGWCWRTVMPEKKWILVDSEYHKRGYIRFDATANYFRFGSITYVRVY